MTRFSDIPQYPLLFILQYIGNPEDFLVILLVCKAWRDRFDVKDGELWRVIAFAYKTNLHLSKVNKSLRSKNNLKRLFIAAYCKRQKDLRERHDLLVSLAKSLLEKPTDGAVQLRKLILNTILDISDFDANWKCISLENNSLLTLSARYGHVKCMKLLVDHFKANIDISDVGGFTPLILNAYRGCFQGVQYLVRRGANISLVGRLRSGTPLTAEHWAAVQGFQEIFQFLRATRLRLEKKLAHLMNRPVVSESPLIFPPIKVDAIPSTLISATANVTSNSNGTSQNDSASTSNGSFCVCGKGFVGDMIACDREGCLIEWYHFECVGIIEKEPNGIWVCPICTGSPMPQPVKHHPSTNHNKKKRKACGIQKQQSDDVNTTTASSSSSIVPNHESLSTSNGSFCVCGRGFVGDMIACDRDGCLIEWYHFDCAGIEEEPIGEWICQLCMSGVSSQSE